MVPIGTVKSVEFFQGRGVYLAWFIKFGSCQLVYVIFEMLLKEG